MNTLELVKSHLLGTLQPGDYIAGFIFCLIGLMIALWFRLRKRNKASYRTPVKFDWGFFIRDNGGKAIVTMSLMFLFFRFCGKLVGEVFSMEWALAFGLLLSFGLEFVIQWMMDRFEVLCNILGMDREEYMAKKREKARLELQDK